MKNISYLILWVLACYGLMSCDKDEFGSSGGKLEGTVWENTTIKDNGSTYSNQYSTITFYSKKVVGTSEGVLYSNGKLILSIPTIQMEYEYEYNPPYIYSTLSNGTVSIWKMIGNEIESDGYIFKRKK